MIKVLTEASFEYGFGHFYRMSGICDEATLKGIDVKMYLHADEIAAKNLSMSYVTIANWIEDFNYSKILNPEDIVIVDSYHVGMDQLQEIQKAAGMLIVIDDNYRLPYQDMHILNPNYYGQFMEYPTDRGNTYYTGKDYTLLRAAFRHTFERNVKADVMDILISMGGTDVMEITEKVISCVDEIRKKNDETFRIHVVTTNAFRNLDAIQSKLAPKDHCYQNIGAEEMCGLMKKCDFAISSAGGTTNELIKTKCPAIVTVAADNQESNVLHMTRNGYMESFDIRHMDNIEMMFSEAKRTDIVNRLKKLESDKTAIDLILGFSKKGYQS